MTSTRTSAITQTRSASKHASDAAASPATTRKPAPGKAARKNSAATPSQSTRKVSATTPVGAAGKAKARRQVAVIVGGTGNLQKKASAKKAAAKRRGSAAAGPRHTAAGGRTARRLLADPEPEPNEESENDGNDEPARQVGRRPDDEDRDEGSGDDPDGNDDDDADGSVDHDESSDSDDPSGEDSDGPGDETEDDNVGLDASSSDDDHEGLDMLEAEVIKLPLGQGKASRKEIAVDNFDGRVKPGKFDTEVRDFVEELEAEVLSAQLRLGHRWSDPVKLSILQSCCTGDAAKFVRQLWRTKKLTFKKALTLLVRQYSTKIDEEDIRERIKSATKYPHESYQMYSQRLQAMADSLPGGVRKRTNAAAAVSAFMKTANPDKHEQLHYWITDRGSKYRKHKPQKLLNKLVEVLSKLDRSGGVDDPDEPGPKRSKGSNGKPQKPVAGHAGHAGPPVVDRKRKRGEQRGGGGIDEKKKKSDPGAYVEPAWVGPKTKCHACNGRGHLKFNPICPKYKAPPLSDAAMKALGDKSE